LAVSLAAAAARINAQLQARKGVQHVDVPAVKSTTPDPASRSTAIAHNIGGEIYVADGDYIKDIEVNDLRNRYLVTKGSTQKMVNNPWLFQLMTIQSSVRALLGLHLPAFRAALVCTGTVLLTQAR
jgi:hypothetical protein